MEQALLNKPDLLRCPDLIVECIEYWCVNREPIAKQHPVGTQSNIQSIEPKKQQRKSWFGRNKSKKAIISVL